MSEASRRAAGRKARPEKTAMVAEFRSLIEGSGFLFLADNRGMGMARTAELRTRLRSAGGRYRVVRNRLFRRAADEAGCGVLVEGLGGATAVVAGEGDGVEAARALLGFVKEHERPVVKAGFVEGRRIEAEEVKALGSLPAKPVMQAMLVGTLAAPMRQLAGALHQKAASIVYVLKAIEEKKAGA